MTMLKGNRRISIQKSQDRSVRVSRFQRRNLPWSRRERLPQVSISRNWRRFCATLSLPVRTPHRVNEQVNVTRDKPRKIEVMSGVEHMIIRKKNQSVFFLKMGLKRKIKTGRQSTLEPAMSSPTCSASQWLEAMQHRAWSLISGRVIDRSVAEASK